MARSHCSLLLVALTAGFVLPVHSSTAQAGAAGVDDDDDDDDDDFVGENAWVKFKLTHGGATHTHPGYLAVAEEEMILTMGEGSGAHEVSITVDKSDAGQWSAKVVYRVGDTTVLSESKDIRTKKWLTFKSADGKSKVELHVDPDSTGAQDIDLGKGKGPLDGLK